MHTKRFTLIAAVLVAGLVTAPYALFADEPQIAESAEDTDTPAEPTADETAPEPEEEPVAPKPTQAAAPIFEHDVEHYNVSVVRADGDALEIAVVPKTSFHVNTLYPWKYEATSTTYQKDAFELTEERASLAVPSAEGGELRFSVCNDDTCLIEKVAVVVE